MEGIIVKCGKCGRELIGLTAEYNQTWNCSKCAIDKKDVLHCERGCKVIAKTLDAGYDYEREDASRLFSVGDVFTVRNVNVGRWSSDVELEEIPQERFNTVFFERCY